jgi:hypothetical protein
MTRTKFNSLNPKAAAAAADTGMRDRETQPITLCVHVASMGGEAKQKRNGTATSTCITDFENDRREYHNNLHLYFKKRMKSETKTWSTFFFSPLPARPPPTSRVRPPPPRVCLPSLPQSRSIPVCWICIAFLLSLHLILRTLAPHSPSLPPAAAPSLALCHRLPSGPPLPPLRRASATRRRHLRRPPMVSRR